jgi:hypothetical protein
VNDICKNKGVDKALAKILYNRRHITANGGDDSNGVSVWLTTQAYHRIPLMLRKVANGLIAWKLNNVKEVESIFSEYVVGLSKEQLFNILKFVYNTPYRYDFLYINMDEPWDTMYHRNFIKLILGGV